MRILVTGFGGFPGAPRNPTERIIANLARHRPRLARAGLELDLSVLPVVYAEIEPRLEALTREAAPDAILHFGLASRRSKLCVETRAFNRISLLRPDAAGAFAQRRLLLAGGSQTGVDGVQVPSDEGRRVPSGEGQALAGGSQPLTGRDQMDPIRAGRPQSPRGAAQSLKSSAPAGLIAARLRRGGFHAAVSIDAGDYVCNQTLFLSLSCHPNALVGFIHVPPLASLRPQSSLAAPRRLRRVDEADRPGNTLIRGGGRLTLDEAVRAAVLAILALIPKLQSRRLSRR
ncbi:peptidase C15 pyroglutamyl peptidase I [Methylocella silvestris BL2]|uniref:Pyroglutamyl-peptidase I n=1 Tax=Methylocella silvestris (strain DSM 15510 / CIP 108128 / LMG 27833 / NCIMB 13906 / BL2) TaxID=395965 RepID=B8ELP9_METSB|nr:peptidase C15 [Methylocella silvestris]ACK50043.1 peptidase C15 pyroglutamyl peptidase I [Methylocella silvestris BL2]